MFFDLCIYCGQSSDCAICPACFSTLKPQRRCFTCGDHVQATDSWCKACLDDPPPWQSYDFMLDLDPINRKLVHEFKYQGQTSRIKRLIRHRWSHWKPNTQLLQHLPSHKNRLRHRGYEPSLVIAREVARMGALKLSNHLARTQNTERLEGKNKSERDLITRGIFRATKVEAEITIIDDVMTTGATLKAAAVLLTRKPHIATLFRTPKSGIPSNSQVHRQNDTQAASGVICSHQDYAKT